MHIIQKSVTAIRMNALHPPAELFYDAETGSDMCRLHAE